MIHALHGKDNHATQTLNAWLPKAPGYMSQPSIIAREINQSTNQSINIRLMASISS